MRIFSWYADLMARFDVMESLVLDASTKMNSLNVKLNKILSKEDRMAQELDNLNAGLDTLATEVSGMSDVVASAKAVLDALVAKQAELSQQLQDAINAGNPAAIQAAADKLAAQNQALDAAKASLAAAIANVPA